MAKSSSNFSAKQLYELITSTSALTNRLNVLRLSYEKGDNSYIYNHILMIEEVILSKKQLPLTKYNALVVTNQILLAAKYSALIFIEIYLLPILKEIALHLAHKRKEEDLELYFIEQGYRESVGIRKVSHKYVNLATQIIFLAAAIKPYQNLLQTELNQPSKFQIVVSKLKSKGVMIPQNCLGREISMLRVAYLKVLKQLNPQQFAQFVTKTIKIQLTFKQYFSQSFKKLIESEDLFITIPTINICVSMLSNITQQFQQKKIYLSLFSSYIRQGHIYAIVIAHNATFIQQIFQQIRNVAGDKDIGAGKYIYQSIDASFQDKMQFYCEFLKCLQIWAVCLPYNQIGQISQMAKYYAYLKQKNFIFPQQLLLKKIQLQFNHNLLLKEDRNDEILKIIESDQSLMIDSAKWKSSVVQLSLKFDKLAGKQSKQGNNKDIDTKAKFQSLIRQTTQKIQGLIYQQNVHSNMQHLKQFQKQWPSMKASFKSQLPSSLIQQGDGLKKKINAIYSHYLRFKKQSIQFETFRRKIASILGFQLSDFNLDQYDDYDVNIIPMIQSKASKKSNDKNSDRTITQNKKIENSLDNAEYQSKINQSYGKFQPNVTSIILHMNPQNFSLVKENEKNNSKQQQKSSQNQYGIRQLLIKRRKYLNESKSSQKMSQSIKTSYAKVIPDELMNEDSNKNPRIRDPSVQNQNKLYKNHSMHQAINQINITPPVYFTDYSSSRKTQNIKGKSISIEEKMKRHDASQIQNESKNKTDQLSKIQKQAKPQSTQKVGNYYNLRSNMYLQKIRYSSTRKAIQSYAKYASKSISSNKKSYDISNLSGKSIINRQYKRMSLTNKNSRTNQEDYEFYYGTQPIIQNSCSQQEDKAGVNIKYTNIEFTQILDLDKYQQYFPSQIHQKFIKNLLKNKGILFINEDIQIGFVQIRKDDSLHYIIYLTAAKNGLSVELKVSNEQNISVQYDQPTSHWSLSKNKQQIAKLSIKIKEIPYNLPRLIFTIKSLLNEKKQIILQPPCTFNKFFNARQINIKRYQNIISSDQINQIKIKQFNIGKVHNIRNKFSSFFSLQSLKKLQKDKKIVCQCLYQSNSFIIQIIQLQKNMATIIGYAPNRQSNELEFILASLCYVLKIK